MAMYGSRFRYVKRKSVVPLRSETGHVTATTFGVLVNRCIDQPFRCVVFIRQVAFFGITTQRRPLIERVEDDIDQHHDARGDGREKLAGQLPDPRPHPDASKNFSGLL